MKTSLIVCLIIAICKSHNAVFVDPQYKLVEWTGWGTTIWGFGNPLAGMSDDVQDEIHSAIFSPDHLNLNVVRYLIAGTTPGDTSCAPFESGVYSESFRDGPDRPYIWSRDPRSRKLLQAAKYYGADTFEAKSMSPPSWLTRNGCTNGNPEGEPLHDNFDPENSNAFADYLTEVIKYYHENYNISFTTVAPFTKPSYGVFNGSHLGVEGCHMERSTMVEVIRSVHASLRTKHLTLCSVSTSDESGVDVELATQTYLTDANVAKLYGQVNTHYYAAGVLPETVSKLFTLSQRNGHKLWMSDTGFLTTSLQNMTQAMVMANSLIFNLRSLLPSAWVYWEVLGPESESNTRIITIPYSNATVENIKYKAGYYVMKQFSKHIRKGYKIIHISDPDSAAAYHDASQILVMVVSNSETTKVTKSFDLRRFSSLGEMFAFRTSRVEAHVPIPVPNINGSKFDFEFPAESITTIKILSAVVDVRENLIRNGDFESGENDPWFLQYGLRDDNGVNGNFVRRGDFSGFMDLTESRLQLVQTASVNTAGTYYLSAWCATTGPNTWLGVLINGLQGPEVTIEASKGYQLYGLSIEAKPTDLLSIYFHSDHGNHTAQIDDVVLH